jgi:uncharacterized protein (DUF302 family)
MINLIKITATLLLVSFMASCQPKQQPKEATPLASDALKGNIEPYYFSTTLSGEFDTIVEKVTAALKSEGFGVITTIDVQKTFKAKLDLDYKKYLILGACNPTFAHKALEAEDKIGTMLPCNVVIQEVGENTYEVAGVNPIASMMAIDNADLAGIAIEVKTKMQAVIEKLE